MAEEKKIDRQALADKIRKRFNASLQHKKNLGLLDQWKEYEDFWEGKHWANPTKQTELLPRPVTNHFAEIIERKASAVLSDMPEIYYTARDGHPNQQLAEDAANVLTAMAKYQSQNLGDNDEDMTLEELCEDFVRTGARLGTAIVYMGWDNIILRGVPGYSAYIGDIVGKEIYPTMFFPGNPDDPGIQTQPWIIVAERRNIGDVKHFYKDFARAEDLEAIKPELETATGETFVYDLQYQKQQDESEQVTILHYWWKEYDEKTGEKILNYAVECQGKILRYEERFYQHGLYPFAVFRWYPKPKSFWGKPESADMIDNQKQINRLDAIMLWSAYELGMPHIRYKRQYIDPRNITNDPGALIEDNAPLNGWAVDYMVPPPLPAYLHLLRDKIVAEMKDVTGVHDAWAGKAPSAQLNASAIIALQEAAGITIKSIQRRFHRTLQDVGKLWLAFWTEFITEQRLVRVIMPDNQETLVWFRGTDYREMKFDVNVRAGVSSPYSKALFISNLDKLLSLGLIEPEEYLEMLPEDIFPYAKKILHKRRLQKQQAQLEQLAQGMVQEGIPPQPIPLQNVPTERGEGGG